MTFEAWVVRVYVADALHPPQFGYTFELTRPARGVFTLYDERGDRFTQGHTYEFRTEVSE